jgi:hypothetical protein
VDIPETFAAQIDLKFKILFPKTLNIFDRNEYLNKKYM